MFKNKPEIIVIGASLGGLDALKVILKDITPHFPIPVVFVQHRDKGSMVTPENIIDRSLTMPFQEIEDKDEIFPGKVYIAPANYHLLIEAGNFALSTEGPIDYARPSINVFLESAADVYSEKIICIILTGANHDGASGAAKIKEKGGLVIVQEPSTAESSIMPKAAIESCKVDYIMNLSEIADFLKNIESAPDG